jgi:uncharacterized membrane protein
MSADGVDAPGPPPEAGATTGDLDDAGTDRLITLSDGVLAIALTLLILSLDVPDPKSLAHPNSMSALWNALTAAYESWIGYLISFYVIAQFWRIHHRVFRGITAHRSGLASWNFLFLFSVSLMPFASDLIGKYSDNPLAVILFSCNLILANVAMHGLLTYGRQHGLLNARGRAVLASYRSWQGAADFFFYAVSIPVALVSPNVAKFCWLGLAVTPRVFAAAEKRRGVRDTG